MYMKTFADFGVCDVITGSLSSVGIETPFEIQELTLPTTLAGQDVIGQAKTGTGKTFAFGIPIIQSEIYNWSREERNGKPYAIVLLPTRELAVQAEKELQLLQKSQVEKLRIALLYGGTPSEEQSALLEAGCDIVVGTPGRIIDHLQYRRLSLDEIRFVVLDEADQMLDYGFVDDLDKILSNVHGERQTLLFSATMPSQIKMLARKYMTNPMNISTLDANDVGGTVDNITNYAYQAHQMDKDALLAKMLTTPGRQKTFIFVKMKYQVEKLGEYLKQFGYKVYPLSGAMAQVKREKNLNKFKESAQEDAPILIATDVAARGLDVDEVSHVFNYDSPDDETTFLHRTGRTGRKGEKGISVTLVDWADAAKWKFIVKELGLDDTPIEEVFSNGGSWEQDLNVDAKVKLEITNPLPPREERGGRDGGRGGRSGGKSDGRRGRDGGSGRRDGGSRGNGTSRSGGNSGNGGSRGSDSRSGGNSGNGGSRGDGASRNSGGHGGSATPQWAERPKRTRTRTRRNISASE
jgi:superfamily II DNA/RNA helicase